MRKSLMGFNLIASFNPDDLKVLLDAKPRAVLVGEDELTRLPEVIDAADIAVYRVMFRGGHWTGYSLDSWWQAALSKPAELGLSLSTLAEQARDKGKQLYIQGPNEPSTTDAGLLASYAQFEAQRAQRIHEEWGARTVVGNFSVGSYDASTFQQFAPALDAIRQLDGALGLHEYGYLVPWAWMGPNQDGDINKIPFTDVRTPAWLVGRFQETVPPDIPILITEFGMDFVGDDRLPRRRSGEAFGGWNTCVSWWRNNFDYDALGVRNEREFYVRLIAWADKFYREHNILGVMLFALGRGSEDRFIDFDIAPAARQIAEYIVNLGDIVDTPPPDDDPEPPPPPDDDPEPPPPPDDDPEPPPPPDDDPEPPPDDREELLQQVLAALDRLSTAETALADVRLELTSLKEKLENE